MLEEVYLKDRVKKHKCIIKGGFNYIAFKCKLNLSSWEEFILISSLNK